MRFLSYLVTLLFASLMAACGGGGGSPGTITGPQALAVNAPAGLIQLVGTAQSFAITGGRGPFSALSNNELVAIAGVTDGTLTIGTVGVGTATITVRDAFGATVDVALTSSVAQPLSTTAGSAITIEIGATQSFRIVGGAGNFSATSANPNIASASSLGSTLTIRGITPGTTSVLVRDGVGTTVSIGVTVTTVGNVALFTTAPSPLNVPISTQVHFSVGGGVPFGGAAPYTLANGSPGIVSATISGNDVTVTGLAVGSATLVLRDSVNASVNVTVTVPAAAALFSSASSPVTIGIGSHAEFVVGGGVGTRLVSSSNEAVAIGRFLDSAHTDLEIDAFTAGSANIQIRDTFGSTPLTIAVTVPAVATATFFTSAPGNITLGTGGTATFTVGGGTAPYFASTDNTAVATVAQPTTSTIAITAVSAGDATITLTDSAGAIVTVGVHVNAGAGAVALFTTSPSAISVEINTTQTYTIGGGTGTYSITNTNPSVATGTVTGVGPTGGTLKIHGLLIGSTTIRVFDGAGTSIPITVTVIPPGTTLTVLPATLAVSELNPNEIDFAISGGTPPYLAFTNNLVLSSVTSPVVGSTLQVKVGTQGTRCVPETTPVLFTVVDAVGATANTTLSIVDNGTCPPPP